MFRRNADALTHESAASEYALATLWWFAAASLLVSLWLVSDGGAPGAIYLRAACIMYLGLTFTLTNEVSRAIRLAVGSVLAILAVAAVDLTIFHMPLYASTILCGIHITLSILTYTGGTMIMISGIRGLSFLLTGLFISVVAVIVSYYENPEAVPRSIVFAFTGVSTAIMANGIPIRERDQVVGSFAALAPAAVCMYCLGSLSEPEPWVIGAAGVIGGLTSALLCISRDGTWRNNMLHMLKFAISSRTMAMFLIVLFTFGNIACINGVARSAEEEWCPPGIPNVTGLAYSSAEESVIRQAASGGRGTLCIETSREEPQLKYIEETIPLLMMGLTKGALAVVVLIGNLSDFAETSAWAMASVMGSASIFMLAIEGRGRCFRSDTADCNVYRSSGFTSGLVICAISTILCWARLAVSGLWVPYVDRVASAALAKALNDEIEEVKTLRERILSAARTRISHKEFGKAIAVTALLICMIATSTSEVLVEGLPEPTGNLTWGDLDLQAAAGIAELYPLYNGSISRCGAFCSSPIGSASIAAYSDLLRDRTDSLSFYWSSTCYIIAAAVLVLSMIAIETVPKSPTAGIALMAALLVTAGRVHYGCLISSMNSRLFSQGVSLIAQVDLNVYIMGVISTVIGLAWGEATLTIRNKAESRKARRQTTDRALTLVIGAKEPQSYKEAFEVLEEFKAVKPLITAGMMLHFSSVGSEPSATNTAWSLLGSSDLCTGSYLMNRTYKDLAAVAKACANGIGTISLLTVVRSDSFDEKEAVELRGVTN